jgi:hypothetical protein
MNKRKFRIQDNVSLLNAYQKAIQISAKIEAKCVEEDKPPYLLDRSIVPTDVLYDITACFETMYQALLDEELIQAGYPKSINTQH